MVKQTLVVAVLCSLTWTIGCTGCGRRNAARAPEPPPPSPVVPREGSLAVAPSPIDSGVTMMDIADRSRTVNALRVFEPGPRTPCDPSLAVGPAAILLSSNSGVSAAERSSARVGATVRLTNPVTPLAHIFLGATRPMDPVCLYDSAAATGGRWIMVAVESTYLHIAISRSPAPAPLDSTNWVSHTLRFKPSPLIRRYFFERFRYGGPTVPPDGLDRPQAVTSGASLYVTVDQTWSDHPEELPIPIVLSFSLVALQDTHDVTPTILLRDAEFRIAQGRGYFHLCPIRSLRDRTNSVAFASTLSDITNADDERILSIWHAEGEVSRTIFEVRRYSAPYRAHLKGGASGASEIDLAGDECRVQDAVVPFLTPDTVVVTFNERLKRHGLCVRVIALDMRDKRVLVDRSLAFVASGAPVDAYFPALAVADSMRVGVAFNYSSYAHPVNVGYCARDAVGYHAVGLLRGSSPRTNITLSATYRWGDYNSLREDGDQLWLHACTSNDTLTWTSDLVAMRREPWPLPQ